LRLPFCAERITKNNSGDGIFILFYDNSVYFLRESKLSRNKVARENLFFFAELDDE